jgi:hypothetical protein
MLAAGGVGAGVVVEETSDRGRHLAAAGAAQPRLPRVALGGQPAGLPHRQHAWAATESRDQFGNPVAPRFDRLLFFDVRGQPTPRHARILEARPDVDTVPDRAHPSLPSLIERASA